MAIPRGKYSRGYLPHFEEGDVPQFVTWRTADAVPASVLAQWKHELRDQESAIGKAEILRRIEAFCDQGHGECPLMNPAAALRVQRELLVSDGSLCELHAWVIMPNHVHCILTPKGCTLAKVLGQIKGASSRSVNQLLGREGTLWQRESFDRLIRNSEHFERTKAYIEWNPVKAKLCEEPSGWAFSSASQRG